MWRYYSPLERQAATALDRIGQGLLATGVRGGYGSIAARSSANDGVFRVHSDYF